MEFMEDNYEYFNLRNFQISLSDLKSNRFLQLDLSRQAPVKYVV